MKHILLFAFALVALSSCKKALDGLVHDGDSNDQFICYTIRQGEHESNPNDYKQVNTGELKFTVRFDSSAIYQSSHAENQYDINKLFGFSDNDAQHHQFSARFGWRWNEGALRVFAYVYNNGTMSSAEIGTVAIGADNNCSIRVASGHYIFSLNGNSLQMPRTAATARASGYKLYPYFGGDETAPHEISIWIKQE